VSPQQLKLTAIALGIHSTIAQVVLMREFFLLYEGNEVSTGLFLGYWMAMGALGARLAGQATHFSTHRLKPIVLALATTPLLSWLLMGIVSVHINEKHLSIPHLILTGVTISPSAFIGGWAFSWLAGSFALLQQKQPIGKTYFFEQGGSALAGLLLYTLLLPKVNSLQILLFYTLTTTIIYVTIYHKQTDTLVPLIVVLLIGSWFLLCCTNYVKWRNNITPGIQITQIYDTLTDKYGNRSETTSPFGTTTVAFSQLCPSIAMFFMMHPNPVARSSLHQDPPSQRTTTQSIFP
jgi:hypothetical protein